MMSISILERLKDIVLSDITMPFVSEELRRMKEEGIDKAIIKTTLEELRNESTNESEEDRILEILDLVTGFCSPAQKIWDG